MLIEVDSEKSKETLLVLERANSSTLKSKNENETVSALDSRLPRIQVHSRAVRRTNLALAAFPCAFRRVFVDVAA